MQPCAQIADFLGRYCGRQPGSELFEPLRPRCDGSTNVIGQPGRDADVARIEIEAGARLLGTRSPKFFAQTAIDRIGSSEEHTSELPSLMRISYAVSSLNKTTQLKISTTRRT